MFDDTRDPNRDLGRRDPYLNNYTDMSDGTGYAPLVALAVIALIVGGLFWFAPSDKTQTASNNPAIERSMPPVSPIPPAPPTTAPKQ